MQYGEKESSIPYNQCTPINMNIEFTTAKGDKLYLLCAKESLGKIFQSYIADTTTSIQ